MRVFLTIYTFLMIAGSILTLTLVPRSLRDLGHERERLREALPDVSYERMVEAGYRFNFMVLLVEIVYYYLLVDFGRSDWRLFYGGAFFGLAHIGFLVSSRFEKRRLSRAYTRSRGARALVWLTAVLTSAEIIFLGLVLFLLALTD
ncbi:MAG: hypothetical protein C4534_00835 [Gaiellales bacterium]|nr:MAG: hypothetical protein C4534_00835 [Gaiellales bacterium]